MQILQLMKYFKVYIAVSFKMSSSCVGLGKKYVGLGSEPELSDLMNEVASKVPAKWKIISIQLGLTLADQHCITALTPRTPFNVSLPCSPSGEIEQLNHTHGLLLSKH